MHESFGARLRQRREEQRVSLGTIADQTKIKLSLLEGLERDDVSRWPSGIFRRAYIRAYAQAIGLCPDDTVREFLERHPDPQEVVGTAGAILAVAERTTPGGPPSRLRNMLDSAFGSLSRSRRIPADDGPASSMVEPAHNAVLTQEEHTVPTLELEVPETVDTAPAETPASDPPAPEITETNPPVADPRPAFELDFEAFANICTRLGCATTADDLCALLREAAIVIGASGVIAWVWDPRASELRPALAHGYSERVLAQLPGVRADEHNATATAFRLAEPRAIAGDEHANGALVVPMVTPGGCAGVLAFELPNGCEERRPVRAAAEMLAAFLALLVLSDPAQYCATAFQDGMAG